MIRGFKRWALPVVLGAVVGFAGGYWLGRGTAAGDLAAARAAERFFREEHGRSLGIIRSLKGDSAKARDESIRREVEHRVSALRELEFLEPVRYATVTREGFRAKVEAALARHYSDDDLAALSAAYATMGFLPEGTDIKTVLLDLMVEQVGAFYEQHEDTLYLFDGADLTSIKDRVILAHELTHALQDQNFRLENMPLEETENDDLALASSALIEGDATLLMQRFTAEDLVERKREALGLLGTILEQEGESFASAPAYLREFLLFPYLKGLEFCTALEARRGMEAITEAFGNPPVSTAQILHPQRYAENPDWRPSQVRWTPQPPEGLKPVWKNVAGEAGIAFLFRQGNAVPDAAGAAEGWQGDGYAVFESGGQRHALWRSVWADALEASEFALALARNLRERHALEPIPISGAEYRAAGKRHVSVRVVGNEVTAVDAGDARAAELLAKWPAPFTPYGGGDGSVARRTR